MIPKYSARRPCLSPDELKQNPLNSEIYEKHDDSELEASTSLVAQYLHDHGVKIWRARSAK